MSTVIQAEGLGKKYRRGVVQESETLRELLTHALHSPMDMLRRAPQETFWALRDVSFAIDQGDVVGIIGRNGAGKTTLLKILARITRPTAGWAEIRGRVGSLLEVGTGFHPELTGRENTFLSGAILGMSKREIVCKFDEIVAFAEIEKFIDTPVKHYSSGMYIRLAFAVAAHLETEILFVDEVLAVGDVQFQKKCLGKMREAGSHGRTILFISHNVNAVSALCRSAIVLAGGQLVHFSRDVSEALRLYASPEVSSHTVNLSHHCGRVKNEGVLEEISIKDESAGLTQCVWPGANVVLELKIRPSSRISSPKVSIGVTNNRGERVFAIGTHIGGTEIPSIERPATIRVKFQMPPLVPGPYTLDIGVYDRTHLPLDEIYGAAVIEVLKDEYISMVEGHGPHTGNIMVRSEWSLAESSHMRSGSLASIERQH